jgi:hypothetical protein
MWILSPIKTIYASLIYTAAYKWGESILPNIPTEAKPTDILHHYRKRVKILGYRFTYDCQKKQFFAKIFGALGREIS